MNQYWHTTCPRVTASLQYIAQQPSLTYVLSQLNADFSVQLLFLGDKYHNNFFEQCMSKAVFTREVHLLLNHIPVVWAQSVCLPQSIWRSHLNCGNQSLGKQLFNGQLTWQRSPIEFAQNQIYPLMRRSTFDLHGDKLYLVECFYPEIQKFILN